MTQETRVFQVDDAKARALEQALRAAWGDAQWRTVPHARFSVRRGDVTVTCYASGKLVVQGRGLDLFTAQFLGAGAGTAATPAAAPSRAPVIPLEVTTVGSDEVGKGDYFGPLVVAAAHARPEDAGWLAELRVADSKTLSDQRALMLAGMLERKLDHQIVVIEPEVYNARHAACGNLNLLLADAHAQAIGPLLGRHCDVVRVLVDRFADERVLARALAAAGVAPPELVQVPRAEASPVVAAASILARATFLEGLRRCEEEAGTDLHKGAGAPVDEAARRVVAIGGQALLAKVAKLHFKNTGRIGGTR